MFYMEKNKEFTAIIHLSIDIHQISPNGEIDGKSIKTDIPNKTIIQIRGETLDEVLSNVKAYLNAS